eukprot:scaffold470233_cov14-Prasinocladus_malaysianus.AAC.1
MVARRLLCSVRRLPSAHPWMIAGPTSSSIPIASSHYSTYYITNVINNSCTCVDGGSYYLGSESDDMKLPLHCYRA